MRWVHDANCFLARYTVDPARREAFIAAAEELFDFAAPWYDYDYPPAYSYSYAVPPPPPDAYDDVPDEAPPPQACGAWSWDASQSAYFWTPCATEGAAAGPPIVGRVAPPPVAPR